MRLRTRGKKLLITSVSQLRRLNLENLGIVSVSVNGRDGELPEGLQEVWAAVAPSGRTTGEELRGLVGHRPKREGGCQASASTLLHEDLFLSSDEETNELEPQVSNLVLANGNIALPVKGVMRKNKQLNRNNNKIQFLSVQVAEKS